MSCKDKRDQFIDICKGIGILCVYYGHTALWGTLPSRIVYSFHMPLFFLLSGMCFNSEKIENAMSLFRKVWKNLLLPYCVFVVIGKMLCWNVAIPKLFSNPIREMWYIIQGEGSYSVWFLMCLAVVQVVAWIVSRSNAPIVRICWMIPGLCVLMGGGLPDGLARRLPFKLASVPIALLFFGIGMHGKRIVNHIKQFLLRVNMLFLSVSLVVGIALLYVINVEMPIITDIRRAIFVPHVLPSCILALMIVLTAGVAISRLRFASGGFVTIGMRSLYLFALELPLNHFVACITCGRIPNLMYKFDHPLWKEPVRFFAVFVLAWLCSYPVERILSKIRGRQ